jgi:hypothetical protein
MSSRLRELVAATRAALTITETRPRWSGAPWDDDPTPDPEYPEDEYKEYAAKFPKMFQALLTKPDLTDKHGEWAAVGKTVDLSDVPALHGIKKGYSLGLQVHSELSWDDLDDRPDWAWEPTVYWQFETPTDFVEGDAPGYKKVAATSFEGDLKKFLDAVAKDVPEKARKHLELP